MSSFVAACYAAVDRLGTQHQAKARRQLKSLVEKVKSEAQLVEQFSSLNRSRRGTAVWVVARLGKRRFVPFLLKVLATDQSEAVRFQAGVSLSVLGGKSALRGLLRLADKPDLTQGTRRAVAYALSFLGEKGALGFLLSSFGNQEQDPQVRGHYAEGIGNLLCGADRRTRVWRQAVVVLLPGLKDDDPEVRFWAAFALGGLRAKAALPGLRRLARTDAAMSKAGWEVGEEAKDAIAHIQGRELEEDAFTRSRKRLGLANG